MRTGTITAVGVLLTLCACGLPPRQPPPRQSPVAEVAARHVDGLPVRPGHSTVAREVYQVTSIAEMVVLSDLVVVGRAIAIAPGRSAGEDAGGRLQWRDVGVEVEDVLYGDYRAITLTVEEFGWKDGIPTTINWASWAPRGDRMLLGLKRSANGEGIAGTRFVLTSTATRFYLRANGDVVHNYVRDNEARQFVLDAAALTVDQLLTEVGVQRQTSPCDHPACGGPSRGQRAGAQAT